MCTQATKNRTFLFVKQQFLNLDLPREWKTTRGELFMSNQTHICNSNSECTTGIVSENNNCSLNNSERVIIPHPKSKNSNKESSYLGSNVNHNCNKHFENGNKR